MVHSQLVFFDIDPSLWFAHTVSRASHGLIAIDLALSMDGLATFPLTHLGVRNAIGKTTVSGPIPRLAELWLNF